MSVYVPACPTQRQLPALEQRSTPSSGALSLISGGSTDRGASSTEDDSCAAIEADADNPTSGNAAGTLLPITARQEGSTSELGELSCPLPTGLFTVSTAAAAAVKHQLPWLPETTKPQPPNLGYLSGWQTASKWWLLLMPLVAALLVILAVACMKLGGQLTQQAQQSVLMQHAAAAPKLAADGSPAAALVATSGLAAAGNPVVAGGRVKGKKGKKGKSTALNATAPNVDTVDASGIVASAYPAVNGESEVAPKGINGAIPNGSTTDSLSASNTSGGMTADLPLSPAALALQSDPGSHHSQLSGMGSDSAPVPAAAAPRSWVDVDGAVVIGRLRVGPGILGYGSAGGCNAAPVCWYARRGAVSRNLAAVSSSACLKCAGTTVYEGVLDGRPVAVKRLLRQFYDLARKEIQVGPATWQPCVSAVPVDSLILLTCWILMLNIIGTDCQ